MQAIAGQRDRLACVAPLLPLSAYGISGDYEHPVLPLLLSGALLALADEPAELDGAPLEMLRAPVGEAAEPARTSARR